MPWTEITRMQYARRGQRYASDSSDEEWALIDAAPVGSRVPAPHEHALCPGRNPTPRGDGLPIGAAAQGLPAIHDRASDARQRPDQRGADGRGVASG